jgi:DNA-binding transcriptional ArsR family regulator
MISLEEMAGTHMMDIMLNPLRMRIIQALASGGNMTTAEICTQVNDVPRTTVYRHIKVLLDHDVLKIVSEEKIRGSLERTLSINVDTFRRNNTLENASKHAFSFLMAKYEAFHRYITSDRANPERDKVFLNNSILMATDKEYDQFLSDLRDLIIKYSPSYAEGRKPRDFSILSIPVKEEKDE